MVGMLSFGLPKNVDDQEGGETGLASIHLHLLRDPEDNATDIPGRRVHVLDGPVSLLDHAGGITKSGNADRQ